MDFTQRIVRIPIAGPEPFNTLVVVRETLSSGFGPWSADGHMHRTPLEFRTSFTLSGYTPSADSNIAFKHSTSLVMFHLRLADDAEFLAAFDGLDAGFDASGRWIVKVDGALSSDGEALDTFAQISSWILCNEPRTRQTRDGDERFQSHPDDPGSHAHAFG
jgi:hypothetical protein